MIRKEEEIEQDKLGVKEQTKKDNNKIDNIVDLYYEL